jgi:N-terminal half of MaoC dehydratase
VETVTPGLDLVEQRAAALLGAVEQRSLGAVSAAAAAEFARAAGDTDARLTDPDHPEFVVHPMYVVSLLRGAPGPGEDEFRPDGMYIDEVPGTAGLDVRLLAGGQDVRLVAAVRADDVVLVSRALTDVTRKRGRADFLLLTVRKTYSCAGRGLLAEVTERFIVR